MNKRLTGAVLVAGALACGCSSVTEELVILQNQVPGAGCTIAFTRSVYRGSGTLDVALVSPSQIYGYLLFPLVQNDSEAVGPAGAGETNRIFLRGFRVRVDPVSELPPALDDLFAQLKESDRANETHLLSFEEPWSGSVDPGGGMVATAVTGVSGEFARRIEATKVLDKQSHVTLMISVNVLGRRAGAAVESPTFRYPIEVCAGCLVAEYRTCPFIPTRLGNPCNVSQDTAVDCCTDGRQDFCPATAPRP